MTAAEDNGYLGRGWSFPPAFSKGGGYVEMTTADTEIQESLRILMGTALNERVMQEDNGLDLRRYIFEEANQTLVANMRKRITRAIDRLEPRIELEQVNVTLQGDDLSTLLIEIDYLVPSTNSRSNLVYPFYLFENAQNPGNG